jgi:hypothetical protein
MTVVVIRSESGAGLCARAPEGRPSRMKRAAKTVALNLKLNLKRNPSLKL